jgi:cytochrome c oxidase subunit 2
MIANGLPNHPALAAVTGGAAGVDGLFDLLLWLGVFVVTLVAGSLLLLVVAQRRRRPDAVGATTGLDGRIPLAAGALLALVAAALVFLPGLRVHLDLSTPPADAYLVTAAADSGRIVWTYPNGWSTNAPSLPAGRPVALQLSSADAIRRVAIPAFRLSRDVSPGHAQTLWFTAADTGTFALQLAEVGASPAAAGETPLAVLPGAEFDQWLLVRSDPLAGLTPAEGGRRLYELFGCAQCHTLDGSRLVGPSFRGLMGSERVFRSGGRLIADAAYVAQSVREPQARVVEGFEPVMPVFADRFGDREVEALVAFLQTLSGTGQ